MLSGPHAGLTLLVAVFVAGIGFGVLFTGKAPVQALDTVGVAREPETLKAAEPEPLGAASMAELRAQQTLSRKDAYVSAISALSADELRAVASRSLEVISRQGRAEPATRPQVVPAADSLSHLETVPSTFWALEQTEPSRVSLALPGSGVEVLANLAPSAGPGLIDEAEIVERESVSEEAAPPSAEPSRSDELLAWQRNAAKPTAQRDWPKIAIVIDDLGNNRTRFRHVAELPGGLTLSFLTYALAIEELAQEARRAGHEVMLHVPMEPQGKRPAVPDLLSADLAPAELDRRVQAALSRISIAAGVNNHMGSRFTQDREKMRRVLSAVRSKGLFFLDSRTSAKSVGLSVARELGIPSVGRDVFLDHHIDERAIKAQLALVERIAREQGYAVAIGHPHAATIDALRAWLPTLPAKRLTITPLSDIIASLQPPTQIARAAQ